MEVGWRAFLWGAHFFSGWRGFVVALGFSVNKKPLFGACFFGLWFWVSLFLFLLNVRFSVFALAFLGREAFWG